jgi:hypothetical protein
MRDRKIRHMGLSFSGACPSHAVHSSALVVYLLSAFVQYSVEVQPFQSHPNLEADCVGSFWCEDFRPISRSRTTPNICVIRAGKTAALLPQKQMATLAAFHWWTSDSMYPFFY